MNIKRDRVAVDYVESIGQGLGRIRNNILGNSIPPFETLNPIDSCKYKNGKHNSYHLVPFPVASGFRVELLPPTDMKIN